MELLASSPRQQSSSSQAIICAENIALLKFLHDVPSRPSTRKPHECVEDDGQRVLSLGQEQQLTGILAAVSSLIEEVNLTTAVALRETRTHGNKQQTTSIEILVAVNKSTVSESDSYLASVCDGLGRIFNTLSRVTSRKSRSLTSFSLLPLSTGHDVQLEYEVFRDIVSVCRERILSRLRFGKHKRGKSRVHLKEPLRNMCDAIASSTHDDARTFLEGTRRLIVALTQFENHQTESELPGLIEEADSWSRMGDMTSLAREIPSSALSGATYEDYRRIFAKVGQYRTAARRLYRLARKGEALRRAAIRPVRLGPEAFVRPDAVGHAPSLEKALDRTRYQRTNKGIASVLSGFMKKDPLTAQSDFVKDVNRVFKESKLHAEVQILAYLKTSSSKDVFPTRVIQSNKKACFLCNETLMLNGIPEIPRSHGRLYPGWMLPPLPAFKQLQLQLNASLQRRADASIQMVLDKKQKIDLLYPVESTALTVSDMASTVADEIVLTSAAPSTEALNGMLAPSDVLEIDEGSKTPKEAAINQASGLPLDIPSTNRDDASIISEVPVKTEDVPSSDTEHAAKEPSFSLSPGETSSVHIVGTSEMTIEYTTESNQPEAGSALVYSHQQLNMSDVESLRSRKTRFYDVLSLAKGSDITLRGPPPFYLDFGDSVAELIFHT